ncbi:hypothetical protein B566_EDAN015365 [Ephemera danica]|nr:hypothetical protein B566_EDAN015365 [Ephemera danica]
MLTFTVIIALCDLNQAATMYSKMESMPEYDAMLKDMQRKSMGHPDPKVGEMVAKMGSNSRRNPEEMGTYFDGDILAPMDMIEN